MPLAISTEQEQLADAVSQFGARHAPIEKSRLSFESLAAGEKPVWWEEFVAQGFHAVHVPESDGGQGGTVSDMACVVEAAGGALLAGPLLSTVTASAVAVQATGSPSVRALIDDFVAGRTGCVILPEHSNFTATACDDGFTISGSSGLTLGICSAERILLPASTAAGETQWFALDTNTTTLGVQPHTGTDLVSDVGALDLQDHLVRSAALLPGVDTERARCLLATFTASAAAGIVGWACQTATDYIRTREQFGRPIGVFQALQHKAATLRVNAEMCVAAAWDAARAADEDIDQHRLAASAAAVVAVAPAPDLVLDALTMFGAIGFTWEHDLHLYWRRATSLAASLGRATRWTSRIAELSREHKRNIGFNLGDAESSFRAEVSTILDKAQTLANDTPGKQRRDRPECRTGPRRDLLADSGLVAAHWPAPWGRDATPLQQVIIAEEFDKRPDLPRPDIGIADWIVPTLLSAGNESLRHRLAGPTLRGEITWCQLFSEPGAGSDLASLRTRAVKVDGGWLINGHKIWNSFADKSEFAGLLARTDPEAKKHAGISYFILDMSTPGIEVRPIKQASARMEFAEVFLTDVFVPDEMLLGEPGQGWALAVGTMAQERVSISNNVTIDRAGALRNLIGGEGADGDPAVEDALGEVDARINAIKAMGVRSTLRLLAGQSPGAASSIAKVAYSLLLRQVATATLRLTDRLAMVQDSDPPVVRPYFDLPAELIGGGTLEIQLTIIAQMILGLPRK